MRTFWLVRDEDVSGVSGTGVIAEGIVWADGSARISWLTQYRSKTDFSSVAEMEAIHGHGGKTRIVWRDAEQVWPSVAQEYAAPVEKVEDEHVTKIDWEVDRRNHRLQVLRLFAKMLERRPVTTLSVEQSFYAGKVELNFSMVDGVHLQLIAPLDTLEGGIIDPVMGRDAPPLDVDVPAPAPAPGSDDFFPGWGVVHRFAEKGDRPATGWELSERLAYSVKDAESWAASRFPGSGDIEYQVVPVGWHKASMVDRPTSRLNHYRNWRWVVVMEQYLWSKSELSDLPGASGQLLRTLHPRIYVDNSEAVDEASVLWHSGRYEKVSVLYVCLTDAQLAEVERAAQSSWEVPNADKQPAR